MQPKEITWAILHCVFPCDLHPDFYQNITAAAAEAGPAAPKLGASFPANPLRPRTVLWRSPLPFQASDGERG